MCAVRCHSLDGLEDSYWAGLILCGGVKSTHSWAHSYITALDYEHHGILQQIYLDRTLVLYYYVQVWVLGPLSAEWQ